MHTLQNHHPKQNVPEGDIDKVAVGLAEGLPDGVFVGASVQGTSSHLPWTATCVIWLHLFPFPEHSLLEVHSFPAVLEQVVMVFVLTPHSDVVSPGVEHVMSTLAHLPQTSTGGGVGPATGGGFVGGGAVGGGGFVGGGFVGRGLLPPAFRMR